MKVKRFANIFVTILTVLLSIAITGCVATQERNAEEEQDYNFLKEKIENISGADGKVYSAIDNAGNSMDTAKIIQVTENEDSFIALYHTYKEQKFKVNMAISKNLIDWSYVVTLGGESNWSASQPTIKAVKDGGYMVAWERESQNDNHLEVLYYESFEKLKIAQPNKRLELPRLKISGKRYPEGTPNFYNVTKDSAEIGYHYYQKYKVDRQAMGVMTDWKNWEAKTLPNLDKKFVKYDSKVKNRNIGSRDYINYKNRDYILIEAYGNNENFGEWRSFIYDVKIKEIQQIEYKTNLGCFAFSNPKLEFITLNGKNAIVGSIFIPSENNKGGESGACIYYNFI